MKDYTFPFSLAWSGFILLGLYLIQKLLRFGRREKNLPPGPPTLPILGNLHQIPSKKFFLKLREWNVQYGDVFSLKIGKSTVVVLNTPRAVHDLVDKKSVIYSERAKDHNSDVVLGSENLAFMHTTPLWRAQRKIASQNLAPRTLDDKVAPIQEAEFCQLMYDLLETPEQFEDHIKRTTASIASIILHGNRAPTWDNFWATCVYRAMDLINKGLEPGSYLPIEQFPILKLIPDRWAPSKQLAKRAYANATQIWTEALERVQTRRHSGDLRISLADKLLGGEITPDIPFSKIQMANFLGAMHQGAADTTMSAMLTMLLYMGKYEWAQEKAREELDRVCGTERMPVWEDFKDLPYINCLVKECLRLRPLVAMGIPHRVKQEDWFDGMRIPKDATIVIPSWTLNHNMDHGSEIFDPERYRDRPKLAMDYAGGADYMKRDHYTYGSGRRICVGIHLAERTQWRFMARVLWAFKIEPAVNESTGEKIDLDTDAYIEGIIRQPKPFKLKISPRSEKHAEVIRRDFGNVKEYLRTWE